jgi:murein DD-endopeptidase MepM/ murein hydrolase activator NlpD
VIKISYKDGTQEQLNLDIVQREYKVDKVNGVASKYVSPPESVLKRIRNDSAIVKQARAGLSFRTDFTNSVTKPAQGRTSGVYGSQRVFNGVPKRPHFGMDIAAKTGTKVIAPWSGKVMLAEPDLYYSGGTLIVDHGMGITTTYIHLSALHVKAGDVVEQGQLVAEIGATGRVTGPHLDWRLNWFNRRLDPQLLLP